MGASPKSRGQPITPPISWMGGKRSCLHEILPRFPARYDRYIEVFGGSGVVLFGKQQTPFEVYNDLNNDLYNFYHCVKHKHLELLQELDFLPFTSRMEFELMRDFMAGKTIPMAEEIGVARRNLPPADARRYLRQLRHRCKLGDVSRAVAFFKLNRLSYAAGMAAFSLQPCDLRSFYRLIQLAHDRLRTVIIENKDFDALIGQYDRPGAFFYADPPYYQAEGCYAVEFRTEDHVRLHDRLAKIGGKFLLSYNDCEEIRALYDGFYIHSYERLNNMTQRYEKGAQYQELLIANYDLEERVRLGEQISIFG